MRIVRLIEIVLGVLFVLAAVLKALDLESFAIQIRYYGVLPDFDWIRYAALFTVACETFLGAALISGARVRGLLYAATAALLAGFTVLVAYAWAFHDLKDCGCFGAVVPLGPGETIAKNLVMIAMIAYAWRRAHAQGCFSARAPAPRRELARSLAALCSLAAVLVTLYTADNYAFFHPARLDPVRPFAQFRVESSNQDLDLGKGEYLIAMLSTTCDDCAAAVEPLNDLTLIDDAPAVVGLVLGSEDDIEHFRTFLKPEFPLQRIEPSLFFRLISPTKPPPRFYIANDGAARRHLDTLHLEIDMLLDFVFEQNEAR